MKSQSILVFSHYDDREKRIIWKFLSMDIVFIGKTVIGKE